MIYSEWTKPSYYSILLSDADKEDIRFSFKFFKYFAFGNV